MISPDSLVDCQLAHSSPCQGLCQLTRHPRHRKTVYQARLLTPAHNRNMSRLSRLLSRVPVGVSDLKWRTWRKRRNTANFQKEVAPSGKSRRSGGRHNGVRDWVAAMEDGRGCSKAAKSQWAFEQPSRWGAD